MEGGAPPYKGGTRGRRTYYIKARSGPNLPPKRLNAFAYGPGFYTSPATTRKPLEAILVAVLCELGFAEVRERLP